MSEKGDRAMELLADVLEAPAEKRAVLLDTACAGEPALRAEVERLLGLGPQANQFLQTLELPPFSREDSGGEHDALRFGRYRALRLIGEGGMGSVYEAQQNNPRRRVAVKVVKLGMDTKQVLARFEAEREALALMDHPNIARVFDAGVSDTGRPFFVMELVKGVPITEYCDKNTLAVRERLDLFIAVCRAVQHAHQKGVIHRDLKPSNVLVALADGKPVPKVIDFGMAKATSGQRLTERTLLTECGGLLGTPEYMSPEQAEMSGIDIDTRSDVYSLGVLLYELLTGTTPFDRKQLRESDHDDVRRLIREVEPPQPSTRLSRSCNAAEAEAGKAVAKARGTEPTALLRAVRGELDWIVMKCLEKDRTRRYETANELATDLARHLKNEPVHAGPPSTAYRLRKFARRNRAALAAAGAMLALLVAGITGTTIGMLRAQAAQGRSAAAEARAVDGQRRAEDLLRRVSEAEAQARQEAAQVATLHEFLMDMFRAARPDGEGGGRNIKVVDMLDRAAASLPDRFHSQPEAEILARRTLGITYGHLGLQQAAVDNLTIAHGLARRHLDEEADLALEVAAVLAFWMVQGDGIGLNDAQLLAHRTYQTAQRKLGETHRITFLAGDAWGWANMQKGDYREAEQIYGRMIELQREAPADSEIARDTSVFHGLAWALRAQRRLPEAEAAQREALRMIGAGGAQSPRQRLVTGGNMALILADQGKLETAADALKNALKAERDLGDTNPEVERRFQDYVSVLVRLGWFDTAVEFAKQRLVRATAAQPRDAAVIALRTAQLAELLSLAGKHDEAVRLFEEAFARRRPTRGTWEAGPWRKWVLQAGLRKDYRWESQAVRAQLWCVLDDILAERPSGALWLNRAALATLRFKLFRWNGRPYAPPDEQATLLAEGGWRNCRR